VILSEHSSIELGTRTVPHHRLVMAFVSIMDDRDGVLGYLGNDLTAPAKISAGSAPKARRTSKHSMTSIRRRPFSYPDTTDCGIPSTAANSTWVMFALRRAAANAA
jgi:hypothetical protein